MAKPFDASLKSLVERYPEDWAAQLGGPIDDPVEVIEADLSAVTTQADKVLRIGSSSPFILHVELQASHDVQLVRRLLRYNVLLHDRHDLPVRSVAVLLRAAADGSALTGTYRYGMPGKNHPWSFDMKRFVCGSTQRKSFCREVWERCRLRRSPM
jgi:predicted transposase YdaD